MSFLLIFHAVLTVVSALVVWPFTSKESALSLLGGGALAFLNLLALTVTWSRVLAKKQVALAFSVIVFKFAILGWILYEVVRLKSLEVGWFSLGMGLVIVTVLVTSQRIGRIAAEKTAEKTKNEN